MGQPSPILRPIFAILLKLDNVGSNEPVAEGQANIRGLGNMTLKRLIKIAEFGDERFEVHDDCRDLPGNDSPPRKLRICSKEQYPKSSSRQAVMLSDRLTSSKETAVLVLADDGQCLRKGFRFLTRIVTMPLQVGPPPVDPPGISRPHIADFANGLLDPLIGAAERGADEEEFDRVILNSLSLTHFIPQVDRWTTMRPELFFQLSQDLFCFVLGKSHGYSDS